MNFSSKQPTAMSSHLFPWRIGRSWTLRWKNHFLVIFGSVLCYFSPEKWWKKAIFAFYSTLVNNCWPHVYPPRKLILETSKGRLEIHFLSISWSQTSYSLRGVEKTFFLPLEYVVEITTFSCISFSNHIPKIQNFFSVMIDLMNYLRTP